MQIELGWGLEAAYLRDLMVAYLLAIPVAFNRVPMKVSSPVKTTSG
jgi:hypothetical protein